MDITAEPRCEICGAPADKIMDGRPFCRAADHNPLTLRPEMPIVRCEVCGYPARRRIAGRDLCGDHEPRHLPRVAA